MDRESKGRTIIEEGVGTPWVGGGSREVASKQGWAAKRFSHPCPRILLRKGVARGITDERTLNL